MSVPQFRLKRNGTVIATWSPPAGDGPDTSPPSRMAGTATRAFFDVPGGAAVYTLEYLSTSPGTITGTISSNANVYHRSILVQGVQQT